MHRNEAKILELLVRVEAVKAELAGISAHDAHTESTGTMPYDQSVYTRLSNCLEAYADEISLYGKGLPDATSVVKVEIVGQQRPVKVQQW